ncbi:MAG: cytochrome c biogenesis protein CcdA [Actinomycetota bacterium]|nr:cytochrome c biogenesis protein CcdA [Actinomycetota bacterium]
MESFATHLPLAFAAGLLSVFSPCVLPLMPAYLSLVSGISVEEMELGVHNHELRRKVMRACVGFVLGFSVVFVTLGIGAVALGQTVRAWRIEVWGIEMGISQLAGVLIIVLGLHMTGLVPIKQLYRDARVQYDMKHHHFAETFLVGAGFALGWSPCVGPILSSVLTMAGSRETVIEGTVLLSIYSAGLAVPFLAAGWSIETFFNTFARVKRHFRKLEIASGSILMVGGLLLATNSLTAFNSRFSFMNDFVNAVERALQ